MKAYGDVLSAVLTRATYKVEKRLKTDILTKKNENNIFSVNDAALVKYDHIFEDAFENEIVL